MTSSISKAFKLPGLRPLLFVGFIAFMVRWLEMLAMALFAYRATESALVVAMLTMLRSLPMGLFGAFIGAAVERFALRSVLILVVAISAATTLAMAVLASLGTLEVWQLMVASFVNGVCWATDNPVRRMMIGNAVGYAHMASALSLDTGANNASRILGPTLAGLLLARFDIASVFWLGVALYAASLVTAVRIRGHEEGTASARVSIFAGLREGFVWLGGDRRLIGIFLVTIIFNIFGWPYSSMVPVIATADFQMSPNGVGLVASCEGLGGLLAALVFTRFARAQWYGRIYVGATALYFVTMLGFAATRLVPVAVVLLLLNGVCGVGFGVMQATLVYRLSPVEMRTRLLGVLSVCIGTSPIGFLYVGFLADLLTPRVATLAIALQGLLALLLTRRYWAEISKPLSSSV
ncbi:MAG: MFS transporter [Burkholderiaceae bacterium]